MKRSKAFVSFDLLFAALPLLLMISHLFTVVWLAAETSGQSLHSSELTGKLAAIADYLVKRGAVERSLQETEFLGTATYRPNAIDESGLSYFQSHKQEEIRDWMGLESLEVSWDEGEGSCIYRLVLCKGELRKLYVCGE